LGERKTKELIEARKSAQFVVAVVALDALVKLVRRKVVDQLGEDDAADMHAPLSAPSPRRLLEPQNSQNKLKSTKLQTPPIRMSTSELRRGSEAIAGQ
jgi:hypothetical protein